MTQLLCSLLGSKKATSKAHVLIRLSDNQSLKLAYALDVSASPGTPHAGLMCLIHDTQCATGAAARTLCDPTAANRHEPVNS